MLYKKGWMPLKQLVSDAISLAFSRYPKLDLSSMSQEDKRFEVEQRYFECVSLTYIDIWDGIAALAGNGEVGVTTVDGNITLVAPSLFYVDDPETPKGRHLDLNIGTVGSRAHEDEDDWGKEFTRTIEQITECYGPFLYLPVVVSQAAADNLLAEIKGGPRPETKSHAAIAREIIASYDADPTRRQRWFKGIYGIGMKNVEWVATWQMAVKERPA